MFDMPPHTAYLRNFGPDTYMVMFQPIETLNEELSGALESLWEEIPYEDLIQVAFGLDHTGLERELEVFAAYQEIEAPYRKFINQAKQLYANVIPPELRLECFEFMEILEMYPGLKMLRFTCNVSEDVLEREYGIKSSEFRSRYRL